MMRDKQTILRRATWALGALFLLLGVTGAAYAQTAGQGLEISPPLVEKTAAPGKQLSFDVKLHNVTSASIVAHATIDDFVANGENGQAKVLTNEKELSPYTFKPWVEAIPDTTLAGGETKTIPVKLDVPANASPGGHYGVIRFTGSLASAQGTSVSLTASIGTLVLLDVPGKVTIKANLLDFYSANQKGEKKSMFAAGPVNFVERVQNQGSVHIQPIGTVRITNTFGKQVAVLGVNPLGGNILPASVRRFEQTLNKTHLYGRYKAEANITYNGQTLNKTISFWIIPWKQVAIILGVIIILIVLIRANTRRAVRRATRSSDKPSKKE